MAGGTYQFYGIDENLGPPGPDGTIDAVGSSGYTITKTAEAGGDPIIDPDTLGLGDQFEVDAFPGLTFEYFATDGAGGIISIVGGLDPDQGTYYFSDTEIVFGQAAPSPVFGDTTICFAAGTLIATLEGEQTVETLTIGDILLTQDGRSVPVKWVGRQTVHKLFTPAERFAPVRVAAGALGEGLPHTDLVLTADHALIIDDLAINAGALVNGTTIAYEPIDSLPERITYYHIETQNHDVILANGAPAETFIDYIGRKAFDNFAEYIDLYGEERAISEMDRPRVSAARLLPPDIRARLAERKVA
jgi:hypothetical protein